jgi:hypothetical protein
LVLVKNHFFVCNVRFKLSLMECLQKNKKSTHYLIQEGNDNS